MSQGKPMTAAVAAAVQKEQAIVYPTLPGNVLNEFQSKLNLKGEESQKKAAANPFDGGNSWEEDSKQEPKNEQIRPQVPVAPQTKSLVPPTSLELETSGILSRNGTEEKNHRIPSVQTPGTATPSASEVQQLKGIIKGCIHNRSQQPNNVPLTIGELSAEIKNKTQHSWGGYWGVRHGPLASFIKAHKDVFSLIKNKYVVLAGTENEANIPEPRKLEQTVPVPAPAQAQAPQHTGPPRGVPLNVLAQQQQQQKQQQQHNPYDNNPLLGYQHPPAQPMYNPYDQPHSFDTSNPFGNQPMLAQNFPAPVQNVGIPPQQPWQHQQQNPFPHEFVPQPLPWETTGTSSSPLDDWMTTPSTTTATALESNPFDVNLKTETTTLDESFWRMDNTTDMNPLAIFDTDNSGIEKRVAMEKQVQEEAEAERRRQQEEDEAFARKLQDEEYEKAKIPDNAPQASRIVLSSTEIREMAESEIGKDNVRIMAGFSVIKYGREGRPKQRKMWVNSSLTHLAWESGQYDGSHRGLELGKVMGIRVGEMTKTIARSTKDYKKVRSLCFSLETQQRTLDLQACSIIQRDSLVAALQKVVDFNHKHKPKRQDKYRTEITVYTT